MPPLGGIILRADGASLADVVFVGALTLSRFWKGWDGEVEATGPFESLDSFLRTGHWPWADLAKEPRTPGSLVA